MANKRAVGLEAFKTVLHARKHLQYVSDKMAHASDVLARGVKHPTVAKAARNGVAAHVAMQKIAARAVNDAIKRKEQLGNSIKYIGRKGAVGAGSAAAAMLAYKLARYLKKKRRPDAGGNYSGFTPGERVISIY